MVKLHVACAAKVVDLDTDDVLTDVADEVAVELHVLAHALLGPGKCRRAVFTRRVHDDARGREELENVLRILEGPLDETMQAFDESPDPLCVVHVWLGVEE